MRLAAINFQTETENFHTRLKHIIIMKRKIKNESASLTVKPNDSNFLTDDDSD